MSVYPPGSRWYRILYPQSGRIQLSHVPSASRPRHMRTPRCFAACCPFSPPGPPTPVQVPSDDPEAMDLAFQILANFAYHITARDDEVDAERPIVWEEWRQRQGAAWRNCVHEWKVCHRRKVMSKVFQAAEGPLE